MGIDEVGIDKVGIDEVGRYRSKVGDKKHMMHSLEVEA